MRILFAGGGTGGHLYPGLAIARAVQRLDPNARPYFVGARRGIEREVLPASGFPHRLLDLHPLYRSRPWQNWRTIVGFAHAWREIGTLAREERPAVVVGTGGYAAAATCAWCAAHDIPVALQEQNSFAGITARLIARVAREIYLGYGEAARSLRPRRGAWMEETGNPIEPPPSPRPARDVARRTWNFPAQARVLLITGGSQGARVLNEVVGAWIARGLPDGVHVIWATGRAAFNDYAKLESSDVRVRAYLSPIAEAYAAADVAVTRAGALTLAELCAWGVPGILVPLPTAAADHQTANARALVASGAARELPQRELNVERLDREVRSLIGEPSRLDAMTRAALSRGRPEAAETIARRVLALARA
ncbi:MAG TPA: UDP-N-acetylglucosamine--N-acetylmuramyl-(pentapeptide) pyrophosphoryl-undecaprenol N-acetylglucosamine transferase [Gemmatimonadaceae bacterium]|nr:UDP-N-acetylglucosamine--N-acetylmuramyl-(pentapeptide) pyrophosphoryl-undecaprenol N-acetylglucosamine transferase [Gemmatimonadaceae bacterium]